MHPALRLLLPALLSTPLLAADAPSAWTPPPGWTQTKGGDIGQTLVVENLSAEGPGSLAAAVAAEGSRLITFKVAGLIDLHGHSLRLRNPNITIAGETAPSPGITLTNGGVTVATHDVILRHLHVRPGAEGHALKSGWEVDGLSTAQGAYDVIVDHCTFTWATDENLSASGPRFEGATAKEWRENTSHRVTFSHCIIAEGLRNSAHGKGPHSMGSLIHDNTSDILIYGNLYLSNNARNPLFKGGARGAVVNNFIHNPGGAAFLYGLVAEEWGDHPWERGIVSVMGNVLKYGRDTGKKASFALFTGPGPCDAYFTDNLVQNADGEPQSFYIRFKPAWDKPTVETDTLKILHQLERPPFEVPGLTARPASEVPAWVLADAGARPWDRDPIDKRLIEQARTGTGKIIDSETEVGGRDAIPHP
jgi:pectate lyase